MKIVDLNLLLYAVNRDSPSHSRAQAWLEATLAGDESVGLPWVVILGFLRITTHLRILERPLPPETASQIVDGWLRQPLVGIIQPGPEHWRILRGLLAEAGTAGNLTTDAHLATLALENGAELCSTDGDFGRYKHLNWRNPLK